MTIRYNIIVFTLTMLLMSCLSTRDLSTTNMATFYKPSDNIYHPEFAVWNQMDSTLQLKVKISPDEFLYVRKDDGDFKASLKIIAQVVRSYDDVRVLDSTSSVFSFGIKDKTLQQVLTFHLATKQTGNLLVRFVIHDLNKGSYEDYFVPLDIDEEISRNDFQLKSISGDPLFTNYFSSSDSIRISYKNPAVKKMWCKLYKRSFSLPAPPFSFDVKTEFDYTPDSIFEVNVNDSSLFVFPTEGFYHLQKDTSLKSGCTLYRFSQGFPNVSTSQQMLESLRYLTSKKEYEEMQKSVNLKSAVDNFWLTRGGSEEKTRALIRKYYGRVQDANKFFTSYMEGWKTDRGMIMVIFGAPSTLYLSETSETWIYGTPNSSLSLSFFFTKVNNPFTPNDMSLSRAPVYESNWYRAVETWRQGRAFNSFN